ncbi:hypothetical protein BDZ91DRAFT_783407 [Kalaharituber pfeilii]|nr:hypothetical protein BDZ91DRAFT_783407 [Kalaharituber pfeilii]
MSKLRILSYQETQQYTGGQWIRSHQHRELILRLPFLTPTYPTARMSLLELYDYCWGSCALYAVADIDGGNMDVLQWFILGAWYQPDETEWQYNNYLVKIVGCSKDGCYKTIPVIVQAHRDILVDRRGITYRCAPTEEESKLKGGSVDLSILDHEEGTEKLGEGVYRVRVERAVEVVLELQEKEDMANGKISACKKTAEVGMSVEEFMIEYFGAEEYPPKKGVVAQNALEVAAGQKKSERF